MLHQKLIHRKVWFWSVISFASRSSCCWNVIMTKSIFLCSVWMLSQPSHSSYFCLVYIVLSWFWESKFNSVFGISWFKVKINFVTLCFPVLKLVVLILSPFFIYIAFSCITFVEIGDTHICCHACLHFLFLVCLPSHMTLLLKNEESMHCWLC